MTLPKLYDYSASGNCYKVRLLLAQLGQPYERVAIDIFDGDTLTDDYERLNPHRSTPVLQLPDGRTLIESNAILWYLAAGTPFLPDDAFGGYGARSSMKPGCSVTRPSHSWNRG